jgi:hypothetical protein
VTERYFIWSNEHRAWWRPARCGYTVHLGGAGEYSRDEAIEICRDAHDGWRDGDPPPEIPVLRNDAIICMAGLPTHPLKASSP